MRQLPGFGALASTFLLKGLAASSDICTHPCHAVLLDETSLSLYVRCTSCWRKQRTKKALTAEHLRPMMAQVARCGGLTPPKVSIHAMTVISSMPLRQCNRCTAIDFIEERHMSRARPSSRWPQQGKATQRAQRALNVIAAASAQAVPLEHLLDVAERAAKAGAAVIAEKVDKPRDIEFKGATDLVTDTDKASEEAVLSVLRAAFPDHALLGEEGGISGDTSSGYLWCIDPLDGTTNYAHKYPSFGVSVAVLEKAEAVAGVVVEFAGGPGTWIQRIYTGAKGKGAFMNGQPINVSQCKDVGMSLLVTGFGYDHDDVWATNVEIFKQFTDDSRGVRRLGAAAVDLCHTALGVVDGYWEYRLKPWDMAAGVIIAQEAGAKIMQMDGEPFTPFSRSIVAANEGMLQKILETTVPPTKALMEKGFDLSPWFVPEGYKV